MAQFTNQAQLAYNNTTTQSNVAVGEIMEVIAATKTPVVSTYNQGDTVTYIISIVNSGSTAMTGLTVTDNLGAYTFGTQTLVPLTYVAGSLKYLVNGVVTTTPTVSSTSPLTITGVNVPANGNATLVYDATVNSYAPLSTAGTIENTATIMGSGLVNEVTATATINTNDAPNLSINKTISPVPVAENGTLTYTFLIENYGNTAATAADNVVLTDTFDPILNNISVTYNGTAWTSPTNYTYDTTTGAFATVAGGILVPAATYTQNATTGVWTTVPGQSTVVVTGTV